MTFQQILHKLLENNIEIVMSKVNSTVWYNLDTRMKSDLLIAEKDGKFIYKARYSAGEFETYKELLGLATDCLHGRDFANSRWVSLLVSEGYLRATTTTVTAFEVAK